MKTILIFALVLASLSMRAGESEDKEFAKKYIGIAGWEWERGGFDTVMLADFVVTNTSPWAIKDVEIAVYPTGQSGTVIDRNMRTIYEIIPPMGVKLFTNVNMGFVDAQAAKCSAVIRDFEFVSPHLSKEQLAETWAAQKRVAETNAMIVKNIALAKKKASADSTLKWNQDQASAGDPYGQLRMGERYRDGAGVEKDLTNAREMFSKSAAQGNKDAAEALKNLPPK